jgi:hypothetical protein
MCGKDDNRHFHRHCGWLFSLIGVGIFLIPVITSAISIRDGNKMKAAFITDNCTPTVSNVYDRCNIICSHNGSSVNSTNYCHFGYCWYQFGDQPNIRTCDYFSRNGFGTSIFWIVVGSIFSLAASCAFIFTLIKCCEESNIGCGLRGSVHPSPARHRRPRKLNKVEEEQNNGDNPTHDGEAADIKMIAIKVDRVISVEDTMVAAVGIRVDTIKE